MGNFMASAVKDDKTAYGWIVAAIAVPTTLATIYQAWSSLIIGLAIIAVSVFSLSAYLKTHKEV
jgi:hypothetical protein